MEKEKPPEPEASGAAGWPPGLFILLRGKRILGPARQEMGFGDGHLAQLLALKLGSRRHGSQLEQAARSSF